MNSPPVSAKESDQFGQLDPAQQELIYADLAQNGVVDDGTPVSINFNTRGKAITGPMFASDEARAPAAAGPLTQNAQAEPGAAPVGALSAAAPARRAPVDINALLRSMMPTPGEDASSKWLALAAGLGKPLQTSSFGESLGNVAQAMQDHKSQQEKLRSQYLPLIMQKVAAQQAAEERAQLAAEAQQVSIQARQQAATQQQAAQAQQNEANRQGRSDIAEANRQNQASIAEGRNDLMRTLKSTQNSADKPLPPVAVKLQNEDLQAIGTFSGIDSDLAGLEKQIDSGKLGFGPINNLKNSALNLVGASTEESRNLATFKAKLENMRNAVLLLNKGVQTEGDAQRAMSEIMSNINDKGLVQQRLAEIRALNARAVQQKKTNIDVLRSNYGHPAFDFSKYDNQPAATNLQGAPAPGSVAQPTGQPDLAALAAAELAKRGKK